MDKTGLVFGYEIFILKGDRAYGPESDYYAIVQCADGKIGPPIVSRVQMGADKVIISIPTQDALTCPASQFTGTVGFNELTGRFGSGKEVVLKRKESFWQ
jgi:hypothetical protein